MDKLAMAILVIKATVILEARPAFLVLQHCFAQQLWWTFHTVCSLVNIKFGDPFGILAGQLSLIHGFTLLRDCSEQVTCVCPMLHKPYHSNSQQRNPQRNNWILELIQAPILSKAVSHGTVARPHVCQSFLLGNDSAHVCFNAPRELERLQKGMNTRLFYSGVADETTAI